MTDPRIQLKNPWNAAIFAFLIPGAGHLYQRRTFKGCLYLVCILGTWLYGMQLGNWRAVYARTVSDANGMSGLAWGYIAQFGVGLPALPAYFQSRRFDSPDNLNPLTLEYPLENQSCTGIWRDLGSNELTPVSGQITIDVDGVGSFNSTQEGKQRPLTLGGFGMQQGQIAVDPRIGSEPTRTMECRVVEPDSKLTTGKLLISVPRSFLNWFEVPPSEHALGELHRMGKIFDLAQVFTWIAGLLNVLVIWDAFEGPAYGYGDETPSTDDKQESQASRGKSSTEVKKTNPQRASATVTNGSSQKIQGATG
ncbi:MAG: DUF6677 family protein [Planctomycetaceae bacterium]